MSHRTLFIKDPNAVLDYTINWTDWLAGDTIVLGGSPVSSQWTVPAGLTKTNESFNATSATVWLSGGTVGKIYEVVNRIVTLGGRTENRTLEIAVEEK